MFRIAFLLSVFTVSAQASFLETAREEPVPIFEGKAVSPKFDWDDLTPYTKANAQPLDWKALFGGEARVVYLGEPHYVKAVKNILASRMDDFKKAGITHIGLEMFGTDRQGVLDTFDPAQTRDTLKKEWGWEPDAYTGMIKAADDASMSRVALDMPAKDRAKMQTECKASGRKGCMGELFQARDKHMIKALSRFLSENPDARILILIGNDHLEVTHQPEALTKATGVKTRSYSFLFGADFFDVAIDEAGLTWKDTFLPLPPTDRGVDGVISMPEIRKEGNGTGWLPGSPD